MQQHASQSPRIVRRDVRRHAHGDAAAAVGEQVGKAGERTIGSVRPVVVGTKVDGVSSMSSSIAAAAVMRLRCSAWRPAGRRPRCQSCLGRPSGAAQVKSCETDDRFVNRGVAMRVEIAHHVRRRLSPICGMPRPGATGAIDASRRARAGAQASGRRAHPAARGCDGGERVSEIALGQRILEVDGLDRRRRRGGGENRGLAHGRGLPGRAVRTQGAEGRKPQLAAFVLTMSSE